MTKGAMRGGQGNFIYTLHETGWICRIVFVRGDRSCDVQHPLLPLSFVLFLRVRAPEKTGLCPVRSSAVLSKNAV